MDNNRQAKKATATPTPSKKRVTKKKLSLFKARKKTEKKSKKDREGSIVKKILTVTASILLTILLIGFITGTIVVGAFAIYIKNYIDPVIDDFDMISTEQKQSSRIYYMNYSDRDNRIGEAVEIEDERLYGSENRVWVSFTEMPTYLYEAFISIEDERFWTHDGVDWKRTLGATYFFFTGGDDYGGSTITQQLIKNITGDKDIRIQRKLQEIMRALYLDKTKDKTEILELYLNTIYLSQGCYGVQAAANTYFGKDVSELSLVECAALASITQAPTKWDPIQNPENNEFRRKTVLDKMYELGKITYSEYVEAREAELVLVNYKGEASGEVTDDSEEYNTWYTDAVIKSVVERLMEEKGYPETLAYNMIYSGGLKIYTVMDPDIQAALDKVYAEGSSVFQDDALPGIIKPESSMVIIHPTTGDVLGIAGGRGEKQGNLLLNYATTTTRSPGSSIKPVSVYAPALEYGVINYGSVYDDVPVNFEIRSTGWPKNAPARYDGLVNINYAIQVSKNTVAIKVLDDLTIDKSFEFLKDKLHMDSLIEKLQLSNGEWITDKGQAALAMGEMNYGVTNLEITAAYSIFTNNGIYNQPRLYTQVLDSDDNVVLDDGCDSSVVISEQTSSIMTKMLKNVVDNGTAKAVSLRSKIDVAGKTGTTNSDHDRWFIGYTPYLLGGVWYGYAEPDSLSKVSGNPAANIWNEVMTIAHEKYFKEAEESGTELKKFEEATGIVTRTVCKDSGLLMTEACRADPRGSRAQTGYYAAGKAPAKFCSTHVLVEYDSKTKAVACDGCPKADVVKIGLLNIETRKFPVQVAVTDAQYMYREMKDGVQMSTDNNQPYFANSLEGIFTGKTGSGSQFNHACDVHIKTPYVPETTQAPVATQPEQKPSDTTAESGNNPTGVQAPGASPAN